LRRVRDHGGHGQRRLLERGFERRPEAAHAHVRFVREMLVVAGFLRHWTRSGPVWPPVSIVPLATGTRDRRGRAPPSIVSSDPDSGSPATVLASGIGGIRHAG